MQFADVKRSYMNIETELPRFASNVELSQMMIEVLISHSGPFNRSHRAEKAVRMDRALLRSSRGKMFYPVNQTSLLLIELPFIISD